MSTFDQLPTFGLAVTLDASTSLRAPLTQPNVLHPLTRHFSFDNRETG